MFAKLVVGGFNKFSLNTIKRYTEIGNNVIMYRDGRPGCLGRDFMGEKVLSQVTFKEAKVIARKIAEQLGESEAKPFNQIANIVKHCGVEFAQEVLRDCLDIEAKGGMMVVTGDRRRTPGGVFFFLARSRMSDEELQNVFFYWRIMAKDRAAREAKFPIFLWDDRKTVFEEAASNPGETRDVNISLVGRPGKIERRQNLVITTMQNQIDESMVFPNGVPNPSPKAMNYLVYISAKQWERVAKLMEQPNYLLVVDGLCAYDDETDGMAVFTTNVSTQKKSNGKKQSKKDEASSKKKQKQAPSVVATSAPTKLKTPAVEDVDINIPAGMSPEDIQKLTGLHQAAATYRQKIASLEAKSEGPRFGLEMTQKLLKSTEQQIESFEKQYAEES